MPLHNTPEIKHASKKNLPGKSDAKRGPAHSPNGGQPAASTRPAPQPLSVLDNVAILLDVDGTLLDIAPTPQEVFVPRNLRETLPRLRRQLGGAIAFISGRPLEDIDRIFAPLKLPAVGGHGAEIRTQAKATSCGTRA